MKTWVLAKSVKGVPLEVFQHGLGTQEYIHIYGGFHGDEPESVDLAKQLNKYFEFHDVTMPHQSIIVVPVANPDGYSKNQRVNAHGVDLNRNFPTKNWTPHHTEPKYFPGKKPASEPEVKGFISLIKSCPPRKIISIHSLIPHQINYDGPGKKMAEAMAKHNRYPVTEHIGYPTPGSLGDYGAQELGVPVVTYELPEKISSEQAWKDSLEAFLEAIRFKI